MSPSRINSRLFVSTAATVLVVLAGLAHPAVAGAAGATAVHSSTQDTLLTAMHGEAYAYARYRADAAQARDERHPGVGQLFGWTASTELNDHFRSEAALAGLVGSNADNLRDSIAGEEYEWRVLYPRFAEQARAQDDDAAADLFTELAADEGRHRADFAAALAVVSHTSPGPIPPGPTVAPVRIVPGGPRSSGVTLQNEITAATGESFAFAKYTLYGDHALRSGNVALARLFYRTAQVERDEHFAELATLAGLVRDTATNLRNAVAGEHYEATVMYPGFAEQAAVVGDTDAADTFTEIARDEAGHARVFRFALWLFGRTDRTPAGSPGAGGSRR